MSRAYLSPSTRHTTLNLDQSLLEEARAVLQTTGVSDTVHRALEDVIKRHRREWLAQVDLPDLTPESVEQMRAESAGEVMRLDERQQA